MTVLLDTHVLHWWSAEPERLSGPATRAVNDAAELAVSSITWFELAWLAERGRIIVSVPIRSWLSELSESVQSVGVTPSIAATAASLPASFPGDAADRLIFATAVERGWQVVTKDRRMHRQRHPRAIAIW